MTPNAEATLAVVVILALCAVGIYRFVLWVMEAPRSADPWNDETDAAVHLEEAVPLCHHCLTPQEHHGWFCPECGATVGPYSNYMPYIYIFAQGEILRAGVTERVRRSWYVTTGFVLFSLGMFAIAAPIYWFFLFKNLRAQDARAEALPEDA